MNSSLSFPLRRRLKSMSSNQRDDFQPRGRQQVREHRSPPDFRGTPTVRNHKEDV
jgi:hypothetical protein